MLRHRLAFLCSILAITISNVLAQEHQPTIISGSTFRFDQTTDAIQGDETAQPIQVVDAIHATDRPSIPLPPPSNRQQADAKASEAQGPLVSVVSSLAIVLGLFCGFVWLTRKTGIRGNVLLGQDVLRVMGTAPIDSRHQAAFIRCGNRVLCVALTQTGASTLAEFTDPSEINDLVAKIEGKSKASFAEALRDVGDGQPARGFLDDTQPPARGLFQTNASR